MPSRPARLAYSAHFPVLLTPQGGLGPEAAQGITQLGIQRVILLGGLTALSQAVEDQIRDKSVNVTRIAGADRTETATAIAEFALGIPSLGFSKSHVNLARGDQDGMGADALAGGPHAGRERSPILLAAGAEHARQRHPGEHRVPVQPHRARWPTATSSVAPAPSATRSGSPPPTRPA